MNKKYCTKCGSPTIYELTPPALCCQCSNSFSQPSLAPRKTTAASKIERSDIDDNDDLDNEAIESSYASFDFKVTDIDPSVKGIKIQDLPPPSSGGVEPRRDTAPAAKVKRKKQSDKQFWQEAQAKMRSRDLTGGGADGE